ncbi:hypothetical protein ABIC56_001143 [Acinetobacter bereziniae]|uniref:hypothetical protein n=1 Tax=Acinetobacter bereziniae TaxID=106648 RepID=UPI002866E9B7|nr:hypothetical protein [Acinetobacter bereziniae]MDR6541127.1 hypothetical protein [Acinetobacter bereziniae]
MNVEELVNYIEVGMTQPVVVDRTLLEEYGRNIRVTGFLKNNKILVSYYFYDGSGDDTGVDIKLQYESLDTAIQSIEQFLGLSIDQWENYNRTGNYPEPLVDFVEDKWADLIAGIQQGTMIPQGYTEIYMNL